jgi:hypothetical protein
MDKQIENPSVEKPESETGSEASARHRMDRIAEEMAEKASRTEEKYDGEHTVFSK